MKREEHTFLRKTVKEYRAYSISQKKQGLVPIRYREWLKKNYGGEENEKYLCTFQL